MKSYMDDAMANPMIRDKIIDRIYGKPIQSTDITSGGDKIPYPIVTNFTDESQA